MKKRFVLCSALLLAIILLSGCTKSIRFSEEKADYRGYWQEYPSCNVKIYEPSSSSVKVYVQRVENNGYRCTLDDLYKDIRENDGSKQDFECYKVNINGIDAVYFSYYTSSSNSWTGETYIYAVAWPDAKAGYYLVNLAQAKEKNVVVPVSAKVIQSVTPLK